MNEQQQQDTTISAYVSGVQLRKVAGVRREDPGVDQMSRGKHPLLTAIAKAQYDLTSAQAWLAEVRRQVSKLELVAPERCKCNCGLSFGSVSRLAEHLYLSHDGPEPSHWLSGESLAKEEAA